MCSPSATGSRQANSTIWARCRGGNLLGTAEAGVVHQEFLQPALLVAATDPPDRGRVTFQAGGDRLDRFAGGNGQDDASVLDLIPTEPAMAGHRLQDGEISCRHGQGARFASTHGTASKVRVAL